MRTIVHICCLAFLSVLFLTACGTAKQVEEFKMDGIKIQAPGGTIPSKHDNSELIIQVGTTKYRVAKEDSSWYLWENGRKAAGFGEAKILVLMKDGFKFYD